MNKIKRLILAVALLSAPALAQAGDKIFVDSYGRIHREQTEMSPVGHIVVGAINTAGAIWAYNSGWNADHSHTRDFCRAMTVLFGLKATIHFGGAVSQ